LIVIRGCDIPDRHRCAHQHQPPVRDYEFVSRIPSDVKAIGDLEHRTRAGDHHRIALRAARCSNSDFGRTDPHAAAVADRQLTKRTGTTNSEDTAHVVAPKRIRAANEHSPSITAVEPDSHVGRAGDVGTAQYVPCSREATLANVESARTRG